MAFGSVYSDCRLPATGPRISQHPAPLDLPCGVRARKESGVGPTRDGPDRIGRGRFFDFIIPYVHTHEFAARITRRITIHVRDVS